MNKKHLLLFISLFLSGFLFAQNNSSDSVQVDAYTVKISLNTDGTYGYEIYKDGQIKEKQKIKAYLETPKGFLRKDNALIIGKWAVGKFLQMPTEREVLNLSKARELGVSEDDLN